MTDKRFVPPTLIEVAHYAKELDSEVDPRAFVDFYQAKGWRVGAHQMRDWRAAFRTWHYRAENEHTGRVTAPNGNVLDWRTMPDGAEKYNAYLCSPEWGKLRAIVGDRSGAVCERCRSNPAVAVHHLTYIRKYAELPEDLLHICQGCHEYTHGKSTTDPRDVIYQGQRPLSGIGPEPAFGMGDLLVSCPYCGSENCHLGAVVIDADASLGNQGSIVIVMSCEMGCEWEMVFAGHKGTLAAYIRNGRRIDHA